VNNKTLFTDALSYKFKKLSQAS